MHSELSLYPIPIIAFACTIPQCPKRAIQRFWCPGKGGRGGVGLSVVGRRAKRFARWERQGEREREPRQKEQRGTIANENSNGRMRLRLEGYVIFRERSRSCIFLRDFKFNEGQPSSFDIRVNWFANLLFFFLNSEFSDVAENKIISSLFASSRDTDITGSIRNKIFFLN